MPLFFSKNTRQRRGFTLVAMAISATALVAVTGLALDLGRLYIAKNETQIYCDAAALAAAKQLNGLSQGITAATAAATAVNNSYNLNSTNATGSTITFANSASGPWLAAASLPSSPAGYNYARVSLPVQMPLYFLPLVAKRYTQQVASTAAAGQVEITSFGAGLGPYSLVSTDTSGPRFGLSPGSEYTIQWPQFNGTRAGCNYGNPEKCFNQDPCDDDSRASMWAVASNWSSSTNGYWGFSSNSDIERSVINGLQTAPVSVGDNILPVMTNGNKAAQASVLDQRATQDTDYTSGSTSQYQVSNTRNGRRIMIVPILYPQSVTQTTVLGFGAVLLYSDGSPSSQYYRSHTNGNSPFCALYLGPWVAGSNTTGTPANGSGAYEVKLVQ